MTPVCIVFPTQPGDTMKKTNKQIQEEITDSIIDALQNSETFFWRRPWTDDPNSGTPTSLSSSKTYGGINFLTLSLASWRKNYQSKWFGTFNQVRHAGGFVQRGSKGHRVVCFRPVTRTKINRDGREEESTFFFQKSFVVFNAEDCGGLDQFQIGFAEPPTTRDQRFQQAQRFVESIEGFTLNHGGNKAHCNGTHIQMPKLGFFESQQRYWETLCHELIHMTEVKLNWDRANQGYEVGELIAEIGSVFLMQRLGLPYDEHMQQHVAYLKSWIPNALKHDPKIIFKAAAQANKAVAWLIANSCLNETEDDTTSAIPF